MTPAKLRAPIGVGRCSVVLGRWLIDARAAGEREIDAARHDQVLATGERLSVPVLVAALESAGIPAEGEDASALIRTDSRFGEAEVDLAVTRTQVRQRLGDRHTVKVVTGFFGADAAGRTALLGRGASDTSATLLAACLDAERVELWSDVDGVLSGDPRLVGNAFPLPRLSYDEAAELAFYGAKVLHKRSIAPARNQAIPIWVGNTFHPDAPGTWIQAEAPPANPSRRGSHRVRAFAAVAAVSTLQLEASREIELAEASARVLALLKRFHTTPLLITQTSSRPTFSLTLASEAASAIHQAISWELAEEIAVGLVERPRRQDGLATLAVVGAGNEAHSPTRALLAALESSGLGALAVAQGFSPGSAVVLVEARDLPRAAQTVHDQLVLGRRTVSVVVAGATGQIGKALVQQLETRRPSLLEEEGIDLQVVGAFNRKALAWDPSGLPLDQLARLLFEAGPVGWREVKARLTERRPAPTIFVDCTASPELAADYAALLEHGVSVVTPNKLAGSQGYARYDQLQKLARERGLPFRYETTVGAALPVLKSLREIVRRGDRLRSCAGILSGSISYVLSQLNQGVAFSAAVAEARRLGYTEPHPADDLAGEDVARKLVILLREAGLVVEREELRVESLVPIELAGERDPSRFCQLLAAADGLWAERAERARRGGERLVYLAGYDSAGAWVEVRSEPLESPLARVQPGENVVMLWTDHYHRVPLTISGPGAGPEITAAGVLSDVLEAADALA